MLKEIARRIVSLLLAVFCTILVLWKIFGNSPTLYQLVIPALIYLTYKIKSVKTELGLHQEYNKEKFNTIEKRLDNIESKVKKIPIIDTKLNHIDRDLQLIKRKLFKEHPQ